MEEKEVAEETGAPGGCPSLVLVSRAWVALGKVHQSLNLSFLGWKQGQRACQKIPKTLSDDSVGQLWSVDISVMVEMFYIGVVWYDSHELNVPPEHLQCA